MRPDDNNGRLNSTQLSDIKDWRQNSSDAPMPPWQSNGVKHDPVQTQLDLATALPRPEAFREGHIPVNLQKHRLDAYLSPVSSENMAEFKYRITKRKLCNTFHFNGACKKGKFCEYDHSPVSPGVFQALKTVVSVNPCPGTWLAASASIPFSCPTFLLLDCTLMINCRQRRLQKT